MSGTHEHCHLLHEPALVEAQEVCFLKVIPSDAAAPEYHPAATFTDRLIDADIADGAEDLAEEIRCLLDAFEADALRDRGADHDVRCKACDHRLDVVAK